jgi:predicted dehydrogenase
VLIPAFKESGARLKTVASNGGVSGVHAGRKYGFEETTTNTGAVFTDPEVAAVVITTRHDSHARLVGEALRARKHVFVEKPLALSLEELAEIERAYTAYGAGAQPALEAGGAPLLMVGFNRRFAPQVKKIKFIDLLRFLSGVAITDHDSIRMAAATGDTVTVQLRFADGSIGTIHYFANGNKAFPKERLEVFAAGRVLQLDNFRKLTGYGWPGFSKMNLWRQDKGQKACAAAFIRAIKEGGKAPIGFDELMEVSRVAVEVNDALR